MDEFPKKYNLTDCKRKMKKKSNSKTIQEIASVSENLPTKYPPGCKGFTASSSKAFQELIIIPILHNFFPENIKRVCTL